LRYLQFRPDRRPGPVFVAGRSISPPQGCLPQAVETLGDRLPVPGAAARGRGERCAPGRGDV